MLRRPPPQACVFPTAIAYAETVFPVQGKHVTVFVVGSATGEMLLPFVISTLFGGAVDTTTGAVSSSNDGKSAGPIVMMWIVCVATCANMAVYALLVRRGAALSAGIAAAASRAADGAQPQPQKQIAAA